MPSSSVSTPQTERGFHGGFGENRSIASVNVAIALRISSAIERRAPIQPGPPRRESPDNSSISGCVQANPLRDPDNPAIIFALPYGHSATPQSKSKRCNATIALARGDCRMRLEWARRRLRARYYIDPATGLPHIYGHQVTEDEVLEILERPGEDRAGRESSRIALGHTASGRYLRVVYVPDPEPDSVFVITAYELTGKPLAAYRRRRRKKQQ